MNTAYTIGFLAGFIFGIGFGATSTVYLCLYGSLC